MAKLANKKYTDQNNQKIANRLAILNKNSFKLFQVICLNLINYKIDQFLKKYPKQEI